MNQPLLDWPVRVCIVPAVLFLVWGCGGGDGGATQSAADREQRVDLAATSAIATFSGLLGSSSSGDGGAAAVVGEMAAEAAASTEDLPEGGGAGTLDLTCPGGGSAQISCELDQDDSVWHVVTSACRLCRRDGSKCVTIDGAITAVLADGRCRFPRLADITAASVEAEDLSVELSDASGTAIAFVNADGTLTAERTGPGCLVPRGILTLNGTLTVIAPRRGVDVVFAADELVVAGESTGSPCEINGVVDGGLTIDNRAGGRSFAGVFEAFGVTLRPTSRRSADVTVRGGLSTSCLGGQAQLDTVEPLHFTLGRICPSAGRIDITGPEGAFSSVAFTASLGVELDRNGDGLVDETLAHCTDDPDGACTGP